MDRPVRYAIDAAALEAQGREDCQALTNRSRELIRRSNEGLSMILVAGAGVKTLGEPQSITPEIISTTSDGQLPCYADQSDAVG